MTTLARITIAFILALFLSSCAFDIDFGQGVKGNGAVTTDERPITGEFTVVSAAEGLDVYVTQAPEFEIRVEADENVIDLIATDIKGDKLKIHCTQNIGRATKKIFVTLPEITGLYASSGADLVANGIIEADKITLNASSGSDLNAEIMADEANADTSSGADMRLSGEAISLQASASSGAGINAKNLIVQNCKANASSGADISVNVSESLVADASSGADIRYTGEASIQAKNSVSGSVRKN
ncbi:head GIN domain-containing protein [Eudoraea chungangensis]|uniref:head GIN domain-containing protein n=1 Tax=Eudoraea chungangensis TaxID=1481905 RepID=UPI0023EC19FE|nr:head GIN domain-containing protein [Eudoraea chungangensis]